MAFRGGEARQFELRGLRLRDFVQVPAEHLPRGRLSLFLFGSPGGRQRLLVCLFEPVQGIRQFVRLELLYCGPELQECGALVVARVLHNQLERGRAIHVVLLLLFASGVVGRLLRVLASADLCLRERPLPGTGRLFLDAAGLNEPLTGLVLQLVRGFGVDSALGLTDLLDEARWFKSGFDLLPGWRDVHEDHLVIYLRCIEVHQFVLHQVLAERLFEDAQQILEVHRGVPGRLVQHVSPDAVALNEQHRLGVRPAVPQEVSPCPHVQVAQAHAAEAEVVGEGEVEFLEPGGACLAPGEPHEGGVLLAFIECRGVLVRHVHELVVLTQQVQLVPAPATAQVDGVGAVQALPVHEVVDPVDQLIRQAPAPGHRREEGLVVPLLVLPHQIGHMSCRDLQRLIRELRGCQSLQEHSFLGVAVQWAGEDDQRGLFE